MTYQLSLAKLDENTADKKVGPLLKNSKEHLGFIPNLYGIMANQPGLLEVYCFGDQHFRQTSGFSAVEQEVIYLIISVVNGCHYCVAAHSSMAEYQNVPQAVIEAVRQGVSIPDEKLEALSQLTQAMIIQRGWVSEEVTKAFLRAGFTEKHILSVILAVGIKTLSNYTNHMAGTPIDHAFVKHEWHHK